MTAKEVLDKLKSLGQENYKNIIMNHGISEPVYGVKIEELKKIEKQVKKDYRLSLQLFDSGIYDARYLAGLIADEQQMTREQIQHWAESANCHALSEYTVAWVAAESSYGLELAKSWIESKDEKLSSTGWATLSGIVSIRDDSDLDIQFLQELLDKVAANIHHAPNRTKYTMNGFVISAATYVKSLTGYAVKTANKIGAVKVFMGDTACKVPLALDYIAKVQAKGMVGKKRKTVKC